MTREQYKQMREAEVERQKAELDQKRKGTTLSPKEKSQYENEYQSLCQQQAEWAKSNFWTANEDTAYKLNYERYHDVDGSYKRSSV